MSLKDDRNYLSPDENPESENEPNELLDCNLQQLSFVEIFDDFSRTRPNLAYGLRYARKEVSQYSTSADGTIRLPTSCLDQGRQSVKLKIGTGYEYAPDLTQWKIHPNHHVNFAIEIILTYHPWVRNNTGN